MIYFNLSEILFSLFANALLGIVFGILFSVSLPLFVFLKKSVLIFLQAKYFCKRIDKKVIKSRCNFAAEKGNNAITKNICDFLFFFLFGIFFILFTYVFLDGVFRVYCLFTALFFLYLAKRLSDKHLFFIFVHFFSRIYEILLTLFAFFVFPFAAVCLFTFNKTKPLVKKTGTKLKSAVIKLKKVSFLKKIPKKRMQIKNGKQNIY